MPPKIPYKPGLKEIARQLRNQATLGEQLLWLKLRSGGLDGFDFHRQKPLLRYIVDFYCFELALVIEVDGSYHGYEAVNANDAMRDEELKSYGLTVLRFTEMEVRKDMDNVMRTLEAFIESR